MNVDLLMGANTYFLGLLEQRIGRIIGNTRLQENGALRQARGRSQMIVGDAHRIIERCRRKQRKSISVRLNSTNVN